MQTFLVCQTMGKEYVGFHGAFLIWTVLGTIQAHTVESANAQLELYLIKTYGLFTPNSYLLIKNYHGNRNNSLEIPSTEV